MAFANMNDDVERYKQLLDDWQAGDEKVQPEKSAPRPAAKAEPKSAPAKPRAKLVRPVNESAQPGKHPKGAILSVGEDSLVVYRRPVAGKNYDLVYSLLADGSVKIEGMELEQHQVCELGQLSPVHLQRLQDEMRWTRDLVAYNCYNLEDGERIPDPGGAPPRAAGGRVNTAQTADSAPANAAQTAGASSIESITRSEGAARVTSNEPSGRLRIRRGQRIRVDFGDRAWSAVYWGKDKKGSVVAHKTHGHWTLMHLDLKRFKDSLVVASEPDQTLIDEITGHISK